MPAIVAFNSYFLLVAASECDSAPAVATSTAVAVAAAFDRDSVHCACVAPNGGPRRADVASSWDSMVVTIGYRIRL